LREQKKSLHPLQGLQGAHLLRQVHIAFDRKVEIPK
jgi:hypothetical protein